MTMTSIVLARMREMVRSGEARELRIAVGLSLAEMASDVGVHRTSIHHWESGVCLPRGEHALRYARLLRELERVEA